MQPETASKAARALLAAGGEGGLPAPLMVPGEERKRSSSDRQQSRSGRGRDRKASAGEVLTTQFWEEVEGMEEQWEKRGEGAGRGSEPQDNEAGSPR